MSKTVLVLRYELAATLRSKSFLIMAFALPLVGILVFLGASLVRGSGLGAPASLGWAGDTPELQVEGYVDEAGLIAAIPEDIPEGTLVAFADEAAARQALRQGTIAAYYLIPADYLESGNLVYLNPDYRFVSSQEQSWVRQQALLVNLLGNDPARVERVSPPMEVQEVVLSPRQPEVETDSSLAFYLPYAAMMILYFVIMMSASLLLNSVGNEKKNRTLEVLLVSVSPQQLLAGKIVGLGVLGLVQTIIWLVTGYSLLRLAGRTFALPAGLQLPPSVLLWGIVFFLLAYALYASLMAGLGALAPNLREASQAGLVVIWPLLIPLFLIVVLIEQPHGPLAVALSLFPLTAPMAMIARIVVGGVPWWQPVLAAALTLGAAMWVVHAVARLFRAQTLLSGQPFSTGRFLAALLGRT